MPKSWDLCRGRPGGAFCNAVSKSRLSLMRRLAALMRERRSDFASGFSAWFKDPPR